MSDNIYQFSATRNDGTEQSLQEYQNKVVLIVNTASKCGFTPQYEGLQKIYQQYQQYGLEVLAFPCDQFGHQEPGDDGEIAQFCSLNFNTQFPLFKKIEVNGDNAHPLYQYLKSHAKGLLGSQRIKWNFTKFLINRQGEVVKRYAPTAKPESLVLDIKKQLG
ncbi:glutathione peroxidase [Neptunicella sp. SCSIO 80796]|uniref:glutathione peroxidase n=1 Tax=Neptunicella plasticusilytica TaxID=3117012 RepID=UPI003A4DF403